MLSLLLHTRKGETTIHDLLHLLKQATLGINISRYGFWIEGKHVNYCTNDLIRNVHFRYRQTYFNMFYHCLWLTFQSLAETVSNSHSRSDLGKLFRFWQCIIINELIKKEVDIYKLVLMSKLDINIPQKTQTLVKTVIFISTDTKW